MKACDFIIKYLSEKAGIDHIFTYAGGTNSMLLDSAHRLGRPRLIPCRHEQNAALAADGYAKAKSGLGCALAMSGPGATNMITGIAQSFFDSTPVFYLTGNVTTSTYKYDRPLRQFGYQETDIVSLVKPITKQAYFVDKIQRVSAALRSALQQCTINRPGPVLYDIPFDIQKLDVDESQLDVDFSLSVRTRLSKQQYVMFCELLSAARKPLILVGGGIQLSHAKKMLHDFSHRYNLPVVSSLLGRDAFDNTESLYVGYIGSYGIRAANKILAASDMVIVLGSRLDSRQTANIQEFACNKKIIHIDIDPDVIGSTVEPALGINMHLADFFEDFQSFAKEKPLNYKTSGVWLTSINNVRKLLNEDAMQDFGALNPKKFLRELSLAMPDGTTYTADVGNNQMWTAQSFVLKANDRILYSGGLGTMGYAIPAAIGAYFACPDRPLVAVAGDGGFQMSIAELQTIREFNIPVKIVVLNNNMLGLMKNFQDENFNGQYPATVIGYSVPDIEKIADAYGIQNYTLSVDQSGSEAINWLKSQTCPTLLQVKVPNNWGPYPKVLPGSGLGKQYPPLADDVESAIIKELL
ncbi:MAG: hypothetical protein A2Y10_05845 [Planctomycetes bacterium GWF2_41_51]|nr:MAG: hypothetical protein A2Y10_05845 [Planctomycetes bacterium GWF2_41_51]